MVFALEPKFVLPGLGRHRHREHVARATRDGLDGAHACAGATRRRQLSATRRDGRAEAPAGRRTRGAAGRRHLGAPRRRRGLPDAQRRGRHRRRVFVVDTLMRPAGHGAGARPARASAPATGASSSSTPITTGTTSTATPPSPGATSSPSARCPRLIEAQMQSDSETHPAAAARRRAAADDHLRRPPDLRRRRRDRPPDPHARATARTRSSSTSTRRACCSPATRSSGRCRASPARRAGRLGDDAAPAQAAARRAHRAEPRPGDGQGADRRQRALHQRPLRGRRRGQRRGASGATTSTCPPARFLGDGVELDETYRRRAPRQPGVGLRRGLRRPRAS